MSMRLLLAVFMVLAMVPVSACTDVAALNDKIIKDQSDADTALKSLEPKPYTRKSLVIDNTPWYGGHAIPVKTGTAMPSQFTSSDAVVVTFERAMTLPEVARMIQAATNVRTIVEKSSSDDGMEETFLPVDGVEVSGGRVVWQGALPDLLDQIADAFDADWSYDNGTIVIADEITRTFMLHALSDAIDVTGTIENSVSDTAALPEVSLDSETTIQIWTDIQNTVDAIVNSRGRATYSSMTGTITVSGPPSIVHRVEDYLREQNSMRLRRVAVAVRVLTIEATDTNTLGFNLTGLINDAIEGKPFQFSSVGDGLTAGILRSLPVVDPVTGLPATAGVTPNSDQLTSIIEASEFVQRVSLSNSGAIVTLSDIPAPLQIGRSVAYLERVSSSGGDTGNVSLEPGEVNLGLSMNVLPRVIEKDKILLRLAVGITDAQTPFDEYTVGDLSIQLPEISTTGFLQNAILNKGETLVLAGYEKNQASLTDQGTPGGFFTGGTRQTDRTREVTVLIISAQVLPEDPLTVMGR
jgi:type IVB pilus formation R64 PilN family outer membrane protein